MNTKNSPSYQPIPANQLTAIARFAIDWVLQAEGGFSHQANDLGGATNFGISDARDGNKDGLIDLDLNGTGDIAPSQLTREQAIAIYYRDYWLECNCNQLPPAFALMVFDTAVNQGGYFAKTTLQRILGVTPDGIIGAQTLAATKLLNGTLSLIDYTNARCQRYAELVLKRPKQAQFIKGWLHRALVLLSECHILLKDKRYE